MAGQSRSRGKNLNFYSVEKEIQIGKKNAAALTKAVDVLRDPEVVRYLDALGGELSRAGASDRFQFSFTVFRRDAPGIDLSFPWDYSAKELNEAIALCGGPIFIPVKLIEKLDNESELAAVLAHAIAHIDRQHASLMQTKMEVANLSAPQTPPHMSPQRGFNLPVGFLKFARDFELEADTVAIEILQKAGYDPEGLLSYLRKLPVDVQPRMLSPLGSQPSPGERVQNAEAQIKSHANRQKDSGQFSAWKQAVIGR